MEKQPKIIFCTGSYTYLAERMLAHGDFQKGEIATEKFPDGETYHRILTHVEGREVILAGGAISDSETLEIFDLACALVKYGAASLTLVVPYFGYSTMERAVESGEVVKAKTRAMLFSAIPKASKGNKIMLVDLHTEGLSHYFDGSITTVHVYCKSIVAETIPELTKNEVVLASTDAGRAKWVQSLANDMGIPAAFVFKRRLSGAETQVTSISADVKGKDVVIYDDMIRTGGSIVNAAKAYKNAGAQNIFVITTHGLFTNGGLERIKNCGLVKQVVSTDSHPNAMSIKDDFLKVKSISELVIKNLDKNF
ncbi:MAG TPA: ribose-phosphate diphosphokinase [Bacteroidia bacterium]